jgi:hypothetical protein
LTIGHTDDRLTLLMAELDAEKPEPVIPEAGVSA